jgi:hypothetical protein
LVSVIVLIRVLLSLIIYQKSSEYSSFVQHLFLHVLSAGEAVKDQSFRTFNHHYRSIRNIYTYFNTVVATIISAFPEAK